MAKNKETNVAVDANNKTEDRRLSAKDRRLIKMCYKKAYEEYGKGYDKPTWTRSVVKTIYAGENNEFLPDDIMGDVNKGLHVIIESGNSALYLDQAKLIKKHGWDKCREIIRHREDTVFVESLLFG